MKITLTPARKLRGSPKIPGDKSISHRSLMFGALSEGVTRISNLLESGDVHSTWRCLEALGVPIRRDGADVIVTGVGLSGLKKPAHELDCGNSGTTMRLFMGILAGQPFSATMIGDESLSRRPMKRVSAPLAKMGAAIALTRGEVAPIRIEGAHPLQAIDYELPVASAQLKSAILLAGLFAKGRTTVRGLIQSRDHTERMLPHFGVKIDSASDRIAIEGGQRLQAASVTVPGDISSAAFWLAAAQIVPLSGEGELTLENVSLNPSRIGILHVLERMGAKIDTQVTSESPEEIGTIRVSHSRLRGTRIEPEEIPSLIDEIPMLAVLATFAEGETEVRGAEELRVKESDRIEAIARNLRAMGAKIETRPDGFVIQGPQTLHGAAIDSQGDHRIAMAFSIAALSAQSQTEIDGIECVGISYPGFYETLETLTQK